MASGLAARTLGAIKVGGGARRARLAAVVASPDALAPRGFRLIPASLAWAVANVVFWYVVLREMDRRGIYLKV